MIEWLAVALWAVGQMIGVVSDVRAAAEPPKEPPAISDGAADQRLAPGELAPGAGR